MSSLIKIDSFFFRDKTSILNTPLKNPFQSVKFPKIFNAKIGIRTQLVFSLNAVQQPASWPIDLMLHVPARKHVTGSKFFPADMVQPPFAKFPKTGRLPETIRLPRPRCFLCFKYFTRRCRLSSSITDSTCSTVSPTSAAIPDLVNPNRHILMILSRFKLFTFDSPDAISSWLTVIALRSCLSGANNDKQDTCKSFLAYRDLVWIQQLVLHRLDSRRAPCDKSSQQRLRNCLHSKPPFNLVCLCRRFRAS